MSAIDPQSLINEWLPGGYRIRQFIGAGAFAWVYKATTARNQTVAIKVLQDSTGPEARVLFTREIKVLRQLPQSPYCVQYLDDGLTDQGAPFLAMEYVDGATLKDGFRFKPVWAPEEACRLMIQLCDALAALHKLGVAHRDLKPENVMLTRNFQVKLMDFGLVKDAQGLLKLFEEEDVLTGRDFAENVDRAMLAGTPEYMAPEQFLDSMQEDDALVKTDTWTDVYSLGLIFYQLLTGRKLFPFNPPSNEQSAYARALLSYIKSRSGFQDRQLLRPEQIGAELWPMVAWSLRQDPKQRPRTAPEFGAAIAQFLDTGQSNEFDEGEHTNIADMSSLLASFAATTRKAAQAPAPAPIDLDAPTVNTGGAAPFDVGEVQAYRDRRLNARGGADMTLPPGMLSIPPRALAPAPAAPSLHVVPDATPPVGLVAPAPRAVAAEEPLFAPPPPVLARPLAPAVIAARRSSGGTAALVAGVVAAIVVAGAAAAMFLR